MFLLAANASGLLAVLGFYNFQSGTEAEYKLLMMKLIINAQKNSDCYSVSRHSSKPNVSGLCFRFTFL